MRIPALRAYPDVVVLAVVLKSMSGVLWTHLPHWHQGHYLLQDFYWGQADYPAVRAGEVVLAYTGLTEYVSALQHTGPPCPLVVVFEAAFA
jgi:hypothetical protein